MAHHPDQQGCSPKKNVKMRGNYWRRAKSGWFFGCIVLLKVLYIEYSKIIVILLNTEAIVKINANYHRDGF